jgi:phosphoribosylamine-glycine ligase
MAWKLSRERDVDACSVRPETPASRSWRSAFQRISRSRTSCSHRQSPRIDLTSSGLNCLSVSASRTSSRSRTRDRRPSRAAAALESSKSFAKAFMDRHHVPTARFRVCDSADDALTFAGPARSDFRSS